MKPLLALIAAVAQNGVIGRAGAIPWRLSTDLRRFKRLTSGKPVIMGRKTAESLAGPLVDRTNIVMTSRDLTLPGFLRVTSMDEALEVAAEALNALGGNEIMVAGGAEIYAAAIGRADRLYITHIKADVEGDAFFPPIDPAEWRVVHREAVPIGPRDEHASEFTIYERESGSAP